MADARNRTGGDSWLARLERLADARYIWEPSDRGRDFFGEDWILPQAFWEALQTERIDDLAALLPRLQERPFGNLYFGSEAIREQGRQIAQGVIQAVLAACRFAQRDEPAAVAATLRQAAAAFDLAWPAAAVNAPNLRELDDRYFAPYAGHADGAPAVKQSVGFWTAWDMFDRLLGPTRDAVFVVPASGGPPPSTPSPASTRRLPITALPGRLALPSRTARMPLLLYDERVSLGQTALLTVTLIYDNGCAFCPDPLAMGLTALRKRPADAGNGYDAFQDPENIHDSMQRMWRLAGLGQHGYRGRWSMTALTPETIDARAKPGGTAPLDVRSLSGRSAEAAVCCALWSAARGVPGEKPQELRLDRQATITARIKALDLPDNPPDLPLGTVEGVPAKLQAAKGRVQMVLVAEGQDYGTPPAGVDVIVTDTLGGAFDRLLAMHRHVRNYQDHVDGQWRKQWAEEEGQENSGKQNEGKQNDDKVPFIESQGIRLLIELENPRGYLQPSSFRGQRAGTSRPAGAAEEDADKKWVGIDRDQFSGAVPIEGCDLHRIVLTTDAGIGKTSNVEWLHWKINAAKDGPLALLVQVNELPGSLDRFLTDTLVPRFRCLWRDNSPVPGNSSEDLKPKVAEHILRRLRDQGRLVLLLDALDQTVAGSAQIDTLCQIVTSEQWKDCRIVLSGRPHALVQHWGELFKNHRTIGWRFLKLEEFDEGQQERYLGTTADGRFRYKEFIRPEAREILGTPRVLQYLRSLSDAKLSEIRTVSDVYYQSLRHLVREGLERNPTAAGIGLPAGAKPPGKVSTRAIRRAMELLGAIAFEMTSWPAPPEDRPSGRTSGQSPNFDQIKPGDFSRFVDGIIAREQKRAKARDLQRESTTEIDIDRLAALNGILEHGFFDSSDEGDGLQQILWRNTSLQEFFAAYWMSQCCLKKDVPTIDRWLYSPDDPHSDEYYWIWRYAVEMPADGRDRVHWPRAMSPLYRAGDGQTARRANEMIYRSWPAMQQHARETAAARKILDEFRDEFRQIKDGKRGTPEQQQAAAEFAASFVPIPAGTFLLGRPKDKPVRTDEREVQALRKFVDGQSPVQLAELLRPRSVFPGGRHGDQQCRQEQSQWKKMFESSQAGELRENVVQVFVGSAGADDETPAQREQNVMAFEFCRDPVLNRWYRLFDPQHGLRPSGYWEDYAKYSPDPDTPVIYVDWYDAWVFCQWATWDGCGCRLPTEREWEYAAKAGTGDMHYWWADEFDPTKCNAGGVAGRTTAPDDGHCNRFGMRDILGNVFEWCDDWYSPDYSGTGGSDRVYRGGSWSSRPGHCRSAYRYGIAPGARLGSLGFRPARSSVGSGPVESGPG